MGCADRIKPSEWIDPEDWQTIADVHDAYTDVRYTWEEGVEQ